MFAMSDSNEVGGSRSNGNRPSVQPLQGNPDSTSVARRSGTHQLPLPEFIENPEPHLPVARLDDGQRWRRSAGSVVAALAAAGQEFTVDDVRPQCGPPPSPSMWGPLLKSFAAAGAIHAVGCRRVPRRNGRHQCVRIWMGRQ